MPPSTSPDPASRAEKLARLAKLVREGRLAGPPQPLSYAQERLFFLDRLMPNSPLYNIPTVFTLDQPTDPKLLDLALVEVVRRHEVLRSTFRMVDGRPTQQPDVAPETVLKIADFTHEPDTLRDARASEFLGASARQPFDLQNGPVYRASLVRVTREHSYLLLNLHHIVSDAWSAEVLFRELREFYDRAARGENPDLPQLPLQYADYARQQRGRLQGEVLQNHLRFWQDTLRGAPAVLEIPTDSPRPSQVTHQGAFQALRLSADVVAGLRNLERTEGATSFMVLLAAFFALLHSLTRVTDLTVGTPVANRSRPEYEGLIGFFVNTVVLRCDLSGDPTFRELVGRAKAAALAAFEHEELPFEKLVEELQPERSRAQNPLFQVMFVGQNNPGSASENDSSGEQQWNGNVPDVSNGMAKFDLTLFTVVEGSGISGGIEYCTDLFRPRTIQRMVDQYAQILARGVRSPESRLSGLCRPTVAVLDELEAAGTGPRDAMLMQVPVHQMFERQAKATPDAVAVTDGSTDLTYSRVNSQANQVARLLAEHGVGPGDRVATLIPRGPQAAMAVLAILKAGAAVVPFDLEYPADRLDYFAAEADVRLIVVDGNDEKRWTPHSIPVLSLDAVSGDDTDPAVPVDPQMAVYILFTSGSSGQPKGVSLPHRVLSNLVAWQTAGDGNTPFRTLQFAPIGFDVAFQEMFTTWSSGGTLVTVDAETRRDPFALLKWCDDQKIQRLFLPYVALAQLVQASESGAVIPTDMIQIITAGEQPVVTPALARFASRFRDLRLRNQYGPTESHVVTEYVMTGDSNLWPNRPPIGRPISNAVVFVLNQELEPVLPGVPGELYIGGDVLSDGYFNRDGLTAERFIPCPVHLNGGARLYRTGDRARWTSDLELEYLGRNDAQVKVRGHRVELGEIEAILQQHPRISTAAVTCREAKAGGIRLVAYVVAAHADEKDSRMILDWCRRKLPDYMVPADVIWLDEMPLTRSGKVAVSELPVFSEIASPAATDSELTKTEFVVAKLFADLLECSSAHRDDDFFQLGGHSLLALQLVIQIQERFGVEVDIRDIFDHQTVAQLSAHIDARLEISEEVDEELLAEIENLSPDEVRQRLEELL